MSALDDDLYAKLESAGTPPADPALPYLETDAKGKVHFHIDRLGAKLAAETPFANGGNHMYVYRDGAYRPGGKEDVLARVREALGEHWQKQRALDTLTWIEHGLPRLDDAPPLNRINVRNGVLQKFRNNTTGNIVWKREKHDPSLLSPVQIGATYDPDAECPEIDKFISTVLPGHESTVYELAGYLMTPDNRYQKAFMLPRSWRRRQVQVHRPDERVHRRKQRLSRRASPARGRPLRDSRSLRPADQHIRRSRQPRAQGVQHVQVDRRRRPD